VLRAWSATDTSRVNLCSNAATNNRRDAPASLRIAATITAVSKTSRTWYIIDIACNIAMCSLIFRNLSNRRFDAYLLWS